MDEMSIRTDFMRNILSRIISSVIAKKLGFKPGIIFNDPITIAFDERDAEVHVNLNVKLTKDQLTTLLKNVI
ncbi:MAG: hypothetical protein IJ179_09940 [Oscillospiraceae bacterium]|nr:hypothetical protein [Oscillospiraceae bacterium]